MPGEPVLVTTLAERPLLVEPLWDLTDLWPRFMVEDPIATLYYRDCTRVWPDYVLVATAGRTDEVVARGFAVPFALEMPERGALPGDGWDGVIRWSWADRVDGRHPDAVSALEITIVPERRGTGLAGRMVQAMRDLAADQGFAALVAPVRPSRKADEPWTPIGEYAARVRPDGMPADPWMRVHARLGADVVRIAPRSMTVSGSLAEWRAWTGLALAESGPQAVPGALVPVHVDVDQDHAVYVEPNVWMRHALA